MGQSVLRRPDLDDRAVRNTLDDVALAAEVVRHVRAATAVGVHTGVLEDAVALGPAECGTVGQDVQQCRTAEVDVGVGQSDVAAALL